MNNTNTEIFKKNHQLVIEKTRKQTETDKDQIKKNYQLILEKFKLLFPDIQIKQWWRMNHNRILVRGKREDSDYFDVRFTYYEITPYRGKDNELADLRAFRIVCEAVFDYYI